jgi:DNA-binding CsgD family transcriptional regulator
MRKGRPCAGLFALDIPVRATNWLINDASCLDCGSILTLFSEQRDAAAIRILLFMNSFDEIVSEIYEAAVVPEFWPRVLQRLVDHCDGTLASLFVLTPTGMKFVGTPDGEQLISEYIALGRPDYNSRIAARLAIKENGFFDEAGIFPDAKFGKDPFYLDFLYPRGYGWMAGNCVRPPTGELASLSIERRFGRGSFERETIDALNRLEPHIARASLLAIRLGLERARAMTAIMQKLGLPTAVLRGRGKLVAANELFDQLIPSVVQDRRDRLHICEESADALFVDALENLALARQTAVSSIPVPMREDRHPAILHLLPVCGAANDIFSQASSLLVVTPVDRGAVPDADLLQGLFDLTPAEARVARGIGAAQSIEALAEALGVNRETVRTQLKAVLSKTGLSRQQELVSLLAGKALRSG